MAVLTLSSLAANSNGKDLPYTIPTIQTPGGQWIMDSRAIASYIEQTYPEPPLAISTDPNLEEVTALTHQILRNIAFDTQLKIASNLLDGASREYVRRTRKETFGGRELEQVAAEDGGRKVYDKVRPDVARIAELLRVDGSGPFFAVSVVSYSDLVWCAALLFLRSLGDDSLEMLLGDDGQPHVALLEACQSWWERDSM